jgi:peptidoglycan/LPS O-acetylase OafA/YrhL
MRNVFGLGWTGVDLFFVLSGFLIGGILLDAKSSTSYFKTFYVRRFYRIIPIYYLWILSFLALVVFGGKLLQARTHSGVLPPLGFELFKHFLFLQNTFLSKQVSLTGSWFGVSWSLAVEEQFYLAAPLLIKFFNAARLRILLILVIVLAPLLRTYFYLTEGATFNHAYTLMPCRADALALGVLAVLLWRDERFRALLSSHRTHLSLLLATLFAGMIVLWLWFPSPLSLGISLLCAAITYLAAKLSWIFFEGPLVQIGHQTKYAAIPPGEATRLNQVGIATRPKPDHA